MDNKKTRVYQTAIQRILEKLGVDEGQRSAQEDQKIKQLVYEAVAKEVLAFIYDSLDPLKQLAFKADIEETKGEPEKINRLIAAYFQIIPDHQIRLEEKLKVFEMKLYAKLLALRKK